MPRVFANGILVKNMEEAGKIIDNSARFDDASRLQAKRIVSSLISAKNKGKGADKSGEDRVDYISDRLGILTGDVIRVIGLLREEKILADAKDLTAFIGKGGKNRAKTVLDAHCDIESFLFGYLDDGERTYNIKQVNEALFAKYANTSINQLNTVINFLVIKRFLKRTPEYNKNYVTLKPYAALDELREKSAKRRAAAAFITDYLYAEALNENEAKDGGDAAVQFSVLELKDEFNRNLFGDKAKTDEIEDALYSISV